MPRLTLVSILVGAGLWTLLLLAPSLTIIPRVLLLAVLVVTPLALWLVNVEAVLSNLTGFAKPAYLTLIQFVAAMVTVMAFLPTGEVGGLGGLALGWLGFTGLVALIGLARLIRHRLSSAAEMCISVGMIYLSVGGVWLVASRLGVSLLGFGEPIVSLTAAHFHYAGFAALIIAGLTGRWLETWPDAPHTTYRLVATGLIAGMVLVAAGITLSPLLEVVAALVFAASLAGLAWLQLRYLVPRLSRRLAQIVFTISALMVWWAMGAAVLYALSEYTQRLWITIPQMLRVHGEVNALGFVVLNLTGWALLRDGKTD